MRYCVKYRLLACLRVKLHSEAGEEMMELILDRESLIDANRYFMLGGKRIQDLVSLNSTIKGDGEVTRLMSDTHSLFFHTAEDVSVAAGKWREAGAALGEKQAGVAALIVISGLGHMMAAYRDRKIPDDILRDSLREMTIWMDDYEDRTGQTGLSNVEWLLHTLRGTLFRLGRFQFFRRTFDWKVSVAVRKADRLPAAFFTEPEKIRGDGQVDGTNGIHDCDHAWTTRFGLSEHGISGTPLHPGGHAMHKDVLLPDDSWSLAVKPGDGMLDIHIPKDGRMEFQDSRDSILAAMDFFNRHFPDKPYRIIHLCTWFLDAQLQKILSPESNIVRFQREFYLFPVLASHLACYERVFGDSGADIASAPEDTSLRKAVKSFVLAGNRMRYNAGFILPDDMVHFGEARYQTLSAAMLDGMESVEAHCAEESRGAHDSEETGGANNEFD
jgi:hypothetical protein